MSMNLYKISDAEIRGLLRVYEGRIAAIRRDIARADEAGNYSIKADLVDSLGRLLSKLDDTSAEAERRGLRG